MATLEKVRMTLPNGKKFVGTGNIEVIESQEAFWLFDGAQRTRTLGEAINLIDNNTSQVYVGTGSRVRSWQVSFEQWEGSSDEWGDANSNDDILVKFAELGQSLAEAGIDSTAPVTFEYGEYTDDPGGNHSAQDVVPGEVNLPVRFGPNQSATTFRPQITWLDAADINQAIHS